MSNSRVKNQSKKARRWVISALPPLAFRTPPEHDWNANPYFAPITRWIRHFQERGELRGDLGAEEITGLFATTFFGTLLGPAAPRRGRRRAIECLGDIFLDGIRPN